MNEVLAGIEDAFGEEPPFSEVPLAEEDVLVLNRIFGDQGYQLYLQDQVNRQIIRDYLLNAVVLGHVDGEDLNAIKRRAGSCEGRSALSLHMIMRSVEEASDLARECSGSLRVLRPVPGSPPQLELIPN